MGDWQPIKTAPKDGTWIQLWRGMEEFAIGAPLVFGRWDDSEEARVWPSGIYDPFHEETRESAEGLIANEDFFADASFTHWMPLPEPPK